MEDGIPDPMPTPEVIPVSSMFSPQLLLLASLVVALLGLTIAFFLNKRNSRSKGTDLLLVGAPDAGKTSILSALTYGQTLPAHTSLQTNSTLYTLTHNKSFCIVDVPGHPRIRDQYQEYLPNAKTIGFVVDASTISRNATAVAEHLHHVMHTLTSLPPSQALPTLLIIAHKSDLLKSASSVNTNQAESRVKAVLERELERRKVSQSEGVNVEGLGAEDEKTELGGLECSDESGGFKFDQWEGGEVEFVSTFVRPGIVDMGDEKKGEDGLEGLKAWLEEYM